MKTFLAGFVTAVVLAVVFSFWHNVRDAEWMIGAVKLPGTLALKDIQTDMNAKRYEIAKEKIDAFLKTWEQFSSGPDSCTGTGIRGLIQTFSDIPGGLNVTNVEHGAPNRTQSDESNQPAAAAGSAR